MRVLLFCLCAQFALSAPAFRPQAVQIDDHEVLKIFEGILEGLAIDIFVDDIKDCIGDVETIAG